MTTGYLLVDAPNRAQPQGTYPRRGGAKLSGTCIVHTSEGNWRNGVDALTRLVQSRADWGCYHRACDWQDIALYYPWEWETWQDTETNNWAVGISAACRTTDWSTMPADIREGYYRNMARMAADFVAYMRDQYGIAVPLRRLSGAEARARKPGFAAHGDSGVSRSDPGRDFNWDLFFDYTAQALNGTTTSPLEDDMGHVDTISDAAAEKIAAKLLSHQVPREGSEGTNTLGWSLGAEALRTEGIIARTTEAVLRGIFGTKFPRQGDGQSGDTDLSSVLSWSDANFQHAGTATIGAASGLNPEQVNAAIKAGVDAALSGVKATVTLGEGK